VAPGSLPTSAARPLAPSGAASLRRPPSTVMDPTVATALASEFKSNPPSNAGCHSRTY
jgi:hypothetical protein